MTRSFSGHVRFTNRAKNVNEADRVTAAAYKFTAAGGRCTHGPGRWTVGKPRATRVKELKACRAGIHYCRPEHLGWWINTELYEFEDLTPGEAFEHEGSKMVTRRGVVVRRVDGWTAETARVLAFRVADRVRVTAAAALRSAGFEAEAVSLEGLAAVTDEASARAASHAAGAAGYAAGAARYAAGAASYAAWAASDAAWAAYDAAGAAGYAAGAAGYAAWAAGYAAWAAYDAAGAAYDAAGAARYAVRAAYDAAGGVERRWVSRQILELSGETA